MSANSPIKSPVRHPIPLAACILLVLSFGVFSYTGIRTKSATYDEPMHAVAGWVHLHEGDFRINFEDPPLWQYWASLINGRSALNVNWQDPVWQHLQENIYMQWTFSLTNLYRTPGVDGAAFLLRERFMMILLAMGLCSIVCLWAWRLGGPIAAVIAGTLVAFDPNLLGHGALVKNDVPTGLMMACIFYVCWRAGKSLTWINGIGLAMLVGASVTIKFSALLFGPMILALLALRACLPIPWTVLGRSFSTFGRRTAAAACLLLLIGIVSYIEIWAAYGFRYGPASDPSIELNTYQHKKEALQYRFQADHPAPALYIDTSIPLDKLEAQLAEVTDALARAQVDLRLAMNGASLSPQALGESMTFISQNDSILAQAHAIDNNAKWLISNAPPPAQRAATFTQQLQQTWLTTETAREQIIRREYETRRQIYIAVVGDRAPDEFIALLNPFFDHHLLPSAWLHGVLFVHARSLVRGSYLMGHVNMTGWWYYFPLAMLFKTPIATLLAIFGATGIGGWLIYQRRKNWLDLLWPLACVALPFIFYMTSVMAANLNIGIRHVLCVYPLMYIAAGVVLAWSLQNWKRAMMPIVIVLGVMLVGESVSAWPDYIAYFNFAAGGSRGGLTLLSDSNLDWGQDLPLLAEWQAKHPDLKLALAYFGTGELIDDAPNYSALPNFYGIKYDVLPGGAVDMALAKDHILAISATNLQGVYNSDAFAAYRAYKPFTALGGTIYLFDLRPAK